MPRAPGWRGKASKHPGRTTCTPCQAPSDSMAPTVAPRTQPIQQAGMVKLSSGEASCAAGGHGDTDNAATCMATMTTRKAFEELVRRVPLPLPPISEQPPLPPLPEPSPPPPPQVPHWYLDRWWAQYQGQWWFWTGRLTHAWTPCHSQGPEEAIVPFSRFTGPMAMHVPWPVGLAIFYLEWSDFL